MGILLQMSNRTEPQAPGNKNRGGPLAQVVRTQLFFHYLKFSEST
jgi:hypothetical protein